MINDWNYYMVPLDEWGQTDKAQESRSPQQEEASMEEDAASSGWTARRPWIQK